MASDQTGAQPPASKAQSGDDLRAAVQNPVGAMYSLPLKFSFDYGAPNGEASFLNIQLEQRAKKMDIWREPLVTLRAPKLFTLRRDPFERADTDSNTYERWWIEHIGNVWPGAAVATEFFKTFEKFPPRQKPENWNLSEIMERIQAKPVNK